MEQTRVVNKRYRMFDVYIGRPGKWGNPVAIRAGVTRADALEGFRAYLRGRPDLVADCIRELAGKVLGCWCGGMGILTADEPVICHGQILARIADGGEI